MDVVAELLAPCSTEVLYRWVRDLGTYPQWLEIVSRAEPTVDADGGDAWAVDLRGRLGPLARSKRLRMVRTLDDGSAVRFERDELDGRQHSRWVLTAVVKGHPEGSHLEVSLHYGGALFGPVLEPVLREEIKRSRKRLVELVSN